MKLKLTQSELEHLGKGAIQSAQRLGIPLKKKNRKPTLQLVPQKRN